MAAGPPRSAPLTAASELGHVATSGRVAVCKNTTLAAATSIDGGRPWVVFAVFSTAGINVREARTMECPAHM
jgi:hypothetical protein